jgi:hypothetical protein
MKSIHEPTVESYNILLKILARHDWTACEDLFTLMTNEGLAPNEATMDGLLLGYARAGRAPAAVSTAQACFNQYRCRPSIPAFLHVLGVLLTEDDDDGDNDQAEKAMADKLPEARRAATVFKQLWPDETEQLGSVAEKHGVRL